MASRKRDSYGGDDFVVSDDESHQTKKPKTSKKARANIPQDSYGANSKVDANGDRYWEISKMRRVTVSTFRGKTMVNIREYYEKDGQELPGKKGISLPMDQFAALITILPELEIALRESGQALPRPEYPGDAAEGSGGQENTSDNAEDSSGKKNIEATSEEEEDE